MLRRVLVLGMLLTPVLVRAEDNPHLTRARGELDDLRYDKARDSLAEALKHGKSSPSELAEIHRLSGEVAATLGDKKGAEEHFARLLVLDPTAKLASGVSPKISAPFNAARKGQKGKLAVKHEATGGETPVIALIVETDTLGLVKGARAAYKAGPAEDSVEARGTGRIELSLPPAEKIEVVLMALDEHGNRLVEIGRDQPIEIQGPKARTPPLVPKTGGGTEDETGSGTASRRKSRAFYSRWYLWGGLAIGFAGVGTYFGLQAKSAEDDLAELNQMTRDMPFSHDFSEAKKIEDDARQNALIANINFGAAGAFAIVSTILLIRDLTSKDDSSERTAVVPVPVRGGAAVSLSVPF